MIIKIAICWHYGRLGDTYNEVCCYDKILKEASQLLSLRYSSDMWEQNQDTTSNTELSRDSIEVDFKPQNVPTTENQNGLLKTTNAILHHTENINVCISSFHTGQCVKDAEESFNLFEESPKRRSGDTSVENSSKRMNFGNACESKSSISPAKMNVECAMTSLENRFHVASMSKKNFKECQVVPVTLSLSSEAIISENTLSYKSLDNCGKSNKYDNTVMMDAVETDKLTPKPRQASVDSILDSGIGDSCNSVDSTEENFDIAELKNRSLERHCWQPKTRESLAVRLPGMLFSQILQHFRINYTNINCNPLQKIRITSWPQVDTFFPVRRSIPNLKIMISVPSRQIPRAQIVIATLLQEKKRMKKKKHVSCFFLFFPQISSFIFF